MGKGKGDQSMDNWESQLGRGEQARPIGGLEGVCREGKLATWGRMFQADSTSGTQAQVVVGSRNT